MHIGRHYAPRKPEEVKMQNKASYFLKAASESIRKAISSTLGEGEGDMLRDPAV